MLKGRGWAIMNGDNKREGVKLTIIERRHLWTAPTVRYNFLVFKLNFLVNVLVQICDKLYCALCITVLRNFIIQFSSIQFGLVLDFMQFSDG